MPKAKSPDAAESKKNAPPVKSASKPARVPKQQTEQNGAGPRSAPARPAMAQALPVESVGSFGPSEDEIRQRAYELYEQEGYQEGRHEDHWHRAVTELQEKHRKSGRR